MVGMPTLPEHYRAVNGREAMNAVEKILASVSDADLKDCVAELKALDDSGVLPNGKVRALAHRLQDEAGLSGNDARNVANTSVIRIAAFKWAGF